MKILKRFDRALSQFLDRHPRFGIPRLMLYVVAGTLLVFLISGMDRSGLFAWYLSFVPERLLLGEVWRLVSFVFIPSSGSLLFLALELYFYYLIGSSLEQAWGPGKFTAYYLCGMLLNIVYGVLVSLLTKNSIAVTGGYISLSMFFVYATLWPENQIRLFFLIPIKIKWLAWLEAVIFLWNILMGQTLLPLVAVLNYFLFCGDSLVASARLLWFRIRPQAVRFRQRAKQGREEAASRSYSRKCAVCGRTDTQHPELEFRYCSQCAGYHCFCQEHIRSHVHFTE